jgi:hypothetical protein
MGVSGVPSLPGQVLGPRLNICFPEISLTLPRNLAGLIK